MRRKYVMKVVFSEIRIIVLQKEKTFNTFPKEKCDSKPALNTAGKNTLMIEYFFCCLLLVLIYLIYLLYVTWTPMIWKRNTILGINIRFTTLYEQIFNKCAGGRYKKNMFRYFLSWKIKNWRLKNFKIVIYGNKDWKIKTMNHL